MIVIDLSPLALNIMVIECSVPHLLLFVFNIVERNLITAEYVSSPQASLANQPPLTQKARGLARETIPRLLAARYMLGHEYQGLLCMVVRDITNYPTHMCKG